MQISVTGRHMQITDAIREHALGAVQHGLHEFPRVESVHVILDVEKYRHIAEVVIQAPNHIRIEARHESDDMYVSIDGAVEKGEKQLRKHWDKMQNHKARDSLASVDLNAQAAAEGTEESR